MKKPAYIESVRGLAKEMDRSHTAVRNWLKHPAWEWNRRPPWRVADLEAMRVWATEALRPVREAGDPLLTADVSSPALERYRDARARLAELDLLERERALVPVADVMALLMPMTVVLRQAGEGLRQQFGNEAAALFNEALDEAMAHAEKLAAEWECHAEGGARA